MDMPQQNNHAVRVSYDVASALGTGRRDHQEDALVYDFPVGAHCGFVVLSDGMGGHAAGGKASKIAVTEVFSELLFQREDEAAFGADLEGVLHDAAMAANNGILAHSAQNPEMAGMGATLVASVFLEDRLHWLSVGDSPLYLFREGRLHQLNEDHSLAPQIDLMVEHGLIDRDAAAAHPDRNCLTSALGGEEIARIDCPSAPTTLRNGDVVVVASDGLQFLPEPEIERLLSIHGAGSSAEIVQALMHAVDQLDDPDQDNVSVAVARVTTHPASAQSVPSPLARDPAEAAGPVARAEAKAGLVAACLSIFGADRRTGAVPGEGSA